MRYMEHFVEVSSLKIFSRLITVRRQASWLAIETVFESRLGNKAHDTEVSNGDGVSYKKPIAYIDAYCE